MRRAARGGGWRSSCLSRGRRRSVSTELAGVGGAVRVEVGLVSEAVSCLLKFVLFIAEMLNREAKRPKKAKLDVMARTGLTVEVSEVTDRK